MAAGLKECLEKRIAQNTIYPDCRICRAVFYVWNVRDTLAASFCAELKRKENGHAMPIPAENSEDAVSRLRMEWDKCKEKISTCELACPNGLYILVIGCRELLEITGSSALPKNCCIEYARLVDEDRWKSIHKGNIHGDFKEWRIIKQDINAAAVLLMHAAYSRELMGASGNLQKSCVLGIKCREYNAVKEDICNYYYTLLDRQFEDRRNFDKIRELLCVEQNVQKIVKSCVNALSLPFVGYERLKAELSAQYKRPWRQKTAAILVEKYRKVQTNWSNKRILSVLQGTDILSERPNVESLRTHIRIDLEGCIEKFIKQEEAVIKNILYRSFSFHDLKFYLSAELEKCSQKSLILAAETEEDLKKVLVEGFTFKTLEIDGILEGLRQYYDLWDRYIKEYAEGIYQKQLSRFVNEVIHSEAEKFESLKTARDILNNFRDNIKPDQIKEAKESNTRELIYTLDDLERSINNYMNFPEFQEGDGFRVMGIADKEYQGTEDNDVDRRKHPQIHFIFNREFSEWNNSETTRFDWIKHAVNYAPKSVFWELKIYTF